ncbi:hypothetical protein THAOC_04346, partial [Thalassiosira oceanica]
AEGGPAAVKVPGHRRHLDALDPFVPLGVLAVMCGPPPPQGPLLEQVRGRRRDAVGGPNPSPLMQAGCSFPSSSVPSPGRTPLAFLHHYRLVGDARERLRRPLRAGQGAPSLPQLPSMMSPAPPFLGRGGLDSTFRSLQDGRSIVSALDIGPRHPLLVRRAWENTVSLTASRLARISDRSDSPEDQESRGASPGESAGPAEASIAPPSSKSRPNELEAMPFCVSQIAAPAPRMFGSRPLPPPIRAGDGSGPAAGHRQGWGMRRCRTLDANLRIASEMRLSLVGIARGADEFDEFDAMFKRKERRSTTKALQFGNVLTQNRRPAIKNAMPKDDEICANCGKEGSDTVKLKNCTACRLVKYCGVVCQRAHRKQHKKACKQRAAELKDEELYSQGHKRPEEHFCPICTLPIAFPLKEHSGINSCCMKRVCYGCHVAAQQRGIKGCLYCRTLPPENDEDTLAMVHARVAKKDPEAINHLGEKYCHGRLGLQKDMQRAVELWTEAAELGSVEALNNLGVAYHSGAGVKQDLAKGIHFWRKAAMQGHDQCRHNLGCDELREGNYDRAVRHFLIAAKMGFAHSFVVIRDMFAKGTATKEQYAEALKGYQDAVEEMKNSDRDEAKRVLGHQKQRFPRKK